MVSAATAPDAKRKRRFSRLEPPRFGCNRYSGPPFPTGPAMDELTLIASEPCRGDWDWDAWRYHRPKNRPQWMLGFSPDWLLLNDHCEVLLALIRIAPNGHVNLLSLRDVLIRLHNLFGIFPRDGPTRGIARLSIGCRAALAAERWSEMCVQCLMMFKRKVEIPGLFWGLKAVLAAIQLPASKSRPVAATASVTDSLPAFDDTAPHCSMALTVDRSSSAG